MGSSSTITAGSVALFAFLIATQIVAVSLLPRTAAFTNVFWTVACLGVYAVSLWSLAYILYSGMPLSLMVPILSAIVPLASIAVAVIFYKEPASLLKVMLLCSACGIIGVASTVK